jgi:hypothetical protein
MARRGRPVKAVRIDSRDELTREDARIRELTTEFRTLHATLLRDAFETVVQLAAVLREGRLKLKGEYEDWVREDLRIDPDTARNYLRAADVAPALLARYKPLGLRKIYRLGHIPPEKRSQVLRTVRVVRDGESRDAVRMTDAEFLLATRPYVRKGRPVTGNMLAHGLRMRLRAFLKVLDGARRFPKIENLEMRSGVKEDLAALCAAARSLGAVVGAY